MLKLTTAQCSHAGMRENNEDALGIRIREHDACFVLSDGVGGETGGGHAAKLAIHAALTAFESHMATSVHELAGHTLAAAHAAIIADQARHPERSRMAATIIGLFFDRALGQAQWIHAGDSRLYHFRRGVLINRTEDHSLVAQLAAAGLPHDRVNPNLLSQALGHANPTPARPQHIQQLEDGDAYLLCTDGFWHGLLDHELECLLQLAGSAQDWITLLSYRVDQQGARDNYSAIAVWVGDPQSITLTRIAA
ncbi:Serine/threonine protein phosphatase PrpC [Andreprevotia lacus DSM 23236]|jgi:serine/threonine protein phosphatase PrpC|uniref:Serine/threonine protein phosphatase PrpC n=1 Tax=Andreprevotia lacus DSM 23236 TaxID=1121001 RepID=A0A1W1Y068_9NEIS|nr:protein phosphatase 2C domain-containing protein [Andreprevotia lacus]SMC29532.1 Serine/threonine protein phosphatase PrpC [Andreprevotia lacus DSM 23236]